LTTFKKLQDLCRNGRWLVLLALGSVGMMMMFCFLGCGSDSTPKGAASEKKGATAKRGEGMKGAMPLLSDQAVEMGKVKNRVDSQRIEVVPGYSQAELEARHAEQRKKYEEFRANMKIAPGLTQEEIEARSAKQRKKYEEFRANMEIAPGLTQRQLQARQAELRKKFAAADTQVVPGLTQEQLNAKMSQQVRPEARDSLPPSARK
jgi:hypothetical protein